MEYTLPEVPVVVDPVGCAFVTGLLVGAGVDGHALRIVTLREDGVPDGGQRGRYFVAISAIIFYSVSALLVGAGSVVHPYVPVAGLVLSIVGPFIGVSSVLLLKQKVDLFQGVLGVPQFIAVFAAAWVLVSAWW